MEIHPAGGFDDWGDVGVSWEKAREQQFSQNQSEKALENEPNFKTYHSSILFPMTQMTFTTARLNPNYENETSCRKYLDIPFKSTFPTQSAH